MPNTVRAKNDPAVIERRQQVLKYRKTGATLRAIAAKLFVSVATVHSDLEQCLKDVIKADLRDLGRLRYLELERLDDLWRAVWERALSGDLSAVDACLRISEKRCKLLGLEMPAKVEFLLASEVDGVLSKLQAALEPAVFATVLRAIALPPVELPKLN